MTAGQVSDGTPRSRPMQAANSKHANQIAAVRFWCPLASRHHCLAMIGWLRGFAGVEHIRVHRVNVAAAISSWDCTCCVWLAATPTAVCKGNEKKHVQV